jgi:hypothetical protein
MRLTILLFVLFFKKATQVPVINDGIMQLNNDMKLINKNDNITLKCPILNEIVNSRRQDSLIKWFKNDENIKLFNNNKNKIVNNNYLVIKKFNVYDIGLYKCQIINGNGLSKIYNITLKINLTNIEINDLLFNYDSNNNNNNNDDTIGYESNGYDYDMRGGGKFNFIFFLLAYN